MTAELTTIGRAERIQLPDHGEQRIPAKVDTGADVSSIWASEIVEQDGVLSFVLFARGSQYYTGQNIVVPRGGFHMTQVLNSFGHCETRYAVKLPVRILGRRFKASFTLADRSGKIYPILIGRRLLKNKFIVDVSRGEPLIDEEKAQHQRLVASIVNEG